MKYLLMTFGVLLTLFYGGLVAKADAFISGNFVGQLDSFGNVNFSLFCCTASVSTPFGELNADQLPPGPTFFLFDEPSSRQYTFSWAIVTSIFGCGRAMAFPCLAGGVNGGDSGVLPVPTSIRLPGQQRFSQYKWKSVGPFNDGWTFFESSQKFIFGEGSGSVVLNYSLDIFQQPFPVFGDLQVTLSPAPVPEPGTLLLFASGLVPLLSICRRQLRPSNTIS